MSVKHNAVYVNLIVRDMETFATLNKLYVARFGLRPPVRVCVQALPKEHGDIAMGAFACAKSLLDKRVNLHVQSFSTWAPANIGPYSQANLFENERLLFLAGQVGLDPAFMDWR